MKFSLLFLPLSLLPASLCFAETVSGVSHSRLHLQVGTNQTVQERFVFQSFVEGNLTASSPFNSVTVQSASVSRSLAFEDGRWLFEDDFVGVTQAQYSGTYPDGIYTMNGSGETASVSLTSSYPNQPVMTFGGGSWQGGELVLSAEQAESELSLVTNQSDSGGFLSFEIVELSADEVIVEVELNPRGVSGSSISHTVPAGTLKPGLRYEVFAEFDEVTDVEGAGLDAGTTFAVASSATKIILRVQNEILDADLVWTGPKQGSFDFQTETGFSYSLTRSTDLAFGDDPEETITGNGQSASISFDDSASTDGKAFFRVEKIPVTTAPEASAFASLIGGKTYRGFTYTSNNRWSSFGLAGNWSYETTGAQTGRMVLTFDDLGNDPLLERDQYNFDFGADGNFATVETSQSAFVNDEMDDLFEYTLDLTSNSFAPEGGILKKSSLEKPTSDTPSTAVPALPLAATNPATGTATFLDDDRVLLTLPYDEGGNDPAFYRDEITLNFNGTKDVPFNYTEYDGNSVVGMQSSTVELLIPD